MAKPTADFEQARQDWDDAAETFDQAADHGLRDPLVRQAWLELLCAYLPPQPSTMLDIGCGTGSLSLLLAELGHRVIGIDFAPAMIAQAQQKAAAAGHSITFYIMEASAPEFNGTTFDLILCRHLLWALPEPAQVLTRWAALLKPGGRLLLIEGFWHTGGGLHQSELLQARPAVLTNVAVQNLSDQPALWGTAVHDERYLVTAEKIEESICSI
jgi:2-polyprenyl-3-methyl-5-hydroxy-6-metoxy-1,4-benzoquinol methylase